MVGCPYCGEKIAGEARVCRFCNRNVLYSLVLTGSFDDKHTLKFFKIWQALDKKDFRHLLLSNYSQSKLDLSKIPLTLAWDVSHTESQKIHRSLSEFQIEAKLQGGLPSTFLEASEPKKARFSGSSIIYGMLAICFLFVASFIGLRTPKPAPSEHAAIQQLLEQVGREPVSLKVPELAMQAPSPPEKNASTIEKSFGRAEMDHLLNATVFIRDRTSLGSGFLITSDGYLLSNAHVTSSMVEPLIILRDGRQFTATKVKEDVRFDASLLKISVDHVDFLKIGNANELYPSQPVITIGNPGGLSFTVTRGIVSYIGRMIDGVPFIQTDAAINRGNSGGPMINEALEVVGINSMTSLGEQGISFALPINLVCASGGISASIKTTPAWCEPLRVSADMITPPTLQRQNPGGKIPDEQHYQSEVNSYKTELERTEKDLMEEKARLDSHMADLQSQSTADLSNLSKQHDLQSQMAELTGRLAEIPRKKAEAQLRYIKLCISVLQRQKGDPDFSSLSSQIEAQINSLMAQQKSLETALER